MNESRKSYTVGYGKPPRHSRFKPGQSGNPKGRAKGARGFGAELDDELNQTISVTENGRTRKLSKQKAMIKALLAKALKGDAKSVQLILSNSENLRGRGALQASELDTVDKLILDEYRRHGTEDSDDGTPD